MSAAPLSNNIDQQPDIKNLSIEIEPSYPLIIAITEFFRAQKKPRQSLELCRRGLNYFPGDIGLRLGLVMSYWDLSEKDKAWMELKTVVQELTPLAPIFDSFSQYLRQNEQTKISEWFAQLAGVLSAFPGDGPEKSDALPVPSLFPEEKIPAEVDLKMKETLPREHLETKTDSPISHQDVSLFSAEKINFEKERAREGLPDSNILSTLTGWLSQLKESKA